MSDRLCACGCGQRTRFGQKTKQPNKFVSGHNSRVAHPMQGKHHSEETKRRLASYRGEKASSYKHGWSATPTYWTWSGMISRCGDPRNASWEYYGARGISVCPQWADFLVFLADMGERPGLDYQLDRIDPDGDYEPSNCRWLTRVENAGRRRPSRWL